jgi:hypothetical protein
VKNARKILFFLSFANFLSHSFCDLLLGCLFFLSLPSSLDTKAFHVSQQKKKNTKSSIMTGGKEIKHPSHLELILFFSARIKAKLIRDGGKRQWGGQKERNHCKHYI